MDDLELPLDLRPNYRCPKICYNLEPWWEDALHTWLFLSSFSQVLFYFDCFFSRLERSVPVELYPFSFESFLNCVKFANADMENNLYNEIHTAFLRLLSRDRSSIKVTNLVASEAMKHYLSKLSSPPPPTSSRNSENRSSSSKNIVKARWWQEQPITSKFWVLKLLGLLQELAMQKPRFLFLDKLLEALNTTTAKTETALIKLYHELPVHYRVAVLKMLSDLCVQSNTVREYIESCQDSIMEARKELPDIIKERKKMY